MPKTSADALKRGSSQNFDRLFGGSAAAGRRNASGLMMIARERIQTGAQPRTQFDAAGIAELAASIAERREKKEGVEGTGLLQPLLVVPIEGQEGQFRLIAGERRYRATGEIGLAEVPAIVVPLHETEVLATQLIENLQRQDLNALDEAHAIDSLMKAQQLSIRAVAQVLGKTRGYVTNRLDVLKMGLDVQEMVSSREDTLRSAAHIEKVCDPELRQSLIQGVLDESIGEREVLRRIEAQGQVEAQSLAQGGAADISTEAGARLGTSSTGGPEGSGKPTSKVTAQAEKPEGPEQPREDRDPVEHALKPAAKLTAEAARLLQEKELTSDGEASVLSQIEIIEKHIKLIRRQIGG